MNKQAASLIQERELLYISVATIFKFYVLKVDMTAEHITDNRLALLAR